MKTKSKVHNSTVPKTNAIKLLRGTIANLEKIKGKTVTPCQLFDALLSSIR